jgi:hypothetical protein
MALYDLDIRIRTSGSDGRVLTTQNINPPIVTTINKIQAEGLWLDDGAGGGTYISPLHIIDIKVTPV